MSLQSDWKPATTNKPAEFDVVYAKIKVQVARKPDGKEIRVRLATEFDTDWMESQFDEWLMDATDSDTEEMAKLAYPCLRKWRDRIKGTAQNADELAALIDLINALEQSNPGLIRA